ncbi:hypothetical protein E1297_05575 [Roseibium sp. RKSG952]|nr:hypothetical protein [Roseibium sp. RKSG952]
MVIAVFLDKLVFVTFVRIFFERQIWPKVRIVLRTDSGFARDKLMAWCEAREVGLLCAAGTEDRTGSSSSLPHLPHERRPVARVP